MICKAEKKDLYEIGKIMADSIANPWSDENLIASFIDPHTYFLVYKDACVLGYLIYKLIDNEAEIESIAVKEECRNQGIASKLICEINAETIFLEVRKSNIPAISFYNKSGFEQIAIRKNYYNNPCEDAIIMKKGI